jgi:hypothetical protein
MHSTLAIACADKGDNIAIAPAFAPVVPSAVAPIAVAPMTNYGGKKGYRRAAEELDADHDVERRSCDGGYGGYGGWGVLLLFTVACTPMRLARPM